MPDSLAHVPNPERPGETLCGQQMTFPLRLVLSPSTLEAWRADEYASWEDHDCPSEGHVYNILGRLKTQLVLNDAAEVLTVLTSAEYHGDAGGWDDRYAFRGAVGRMARQLREILKAADPAASAAHESHRARLAHLKVGAAGG